MRAYVKARKSPLRISRRRPFDKLRGPARLLRLPLKGGVIGPSNGLADSLPPIWLWLNNAKPR